MPDLPDSPKRGRPPLTPGRASTRVEVLVPATQYDRAYQRAQRDGVSVSALVRRGLTRELATDDDE